MVPGEDVSPAGELPHAAEKKVADARRVSRLGVGRRPPPRRRPVFGGRHQLPKRWALRRRNHERDDPHG